MSVVRGRKNTQNVLKNTKSGGIINKYKGKGIRVQEKQGISVETYECIVKATKRVTSDFKILEKYTEPIVFGDVDGGFAVNSFLPSTGKNTITLSRNDFNHPGELLERLKKDYEKGHSYETDYIESLVAHELGHNAHVALALKRANIPYGKPLNNMQVAIFDEHYKEIAKEIYIECFDNETFAEIQDICTRELGTYTFGNSQELIAQSFGNYYYGTQKSKIAKKIVDYFRKGLK